jgi:DNA polymerase III epsilon subunit family exonuclease
MQKDLLKIINTSNIPRLVYLDIETSGLNPYQGAKIIEIAMLKTDQIKEERYEKLVNPGQPISPQCSQIHFIYDDMIKDAPCFKDIAQEILSFIGDDIVVCHNADFDLSFICKELNENSYTGVKFQYIDTLKLARKYFNFSSNSLENIAKAVGIDVEIKHRAMADVLTMYGVSKYLFSNMLRKGFEEIEVKTFSGSNRSNIEKK